MRLLIYLLLMGISLQGYAQDFQFANYSQNPLRLNPASMGDMAERIIWRVASPHQIDIIGQRASNLSFHHGLDGAVSIPVGRRPYIHVGGHFLTTHNPEQGLQNQEIGAAFGCSFKLGGRRATPTYLTFASDLIYRNTLNHYLFARYNNFSFISQTLPEHYQFLDVNAGIQLNIKPDRRRRPPSTHIGFAVHHLNQSRALLHRRDSVAAAPPIRYTANISIKQKHTWRSRSPIGYSLDCFWTWQDRHWQVFPNAGILLAFRPLNEIEGLENLCLSTSTGLRIANSPNIEQIELMITSTVGLRLNNLSFHLGFSKLLGQAGWIQEVGLKYAHQRRSRGYGGFYF